MIAIYDTKARAKREFIPVHPGKIGMYVCGPTVYNYIHIGNARTFISFDTIRRYLMWRGFDVTFVQNVTDVDDKIINKAREEGRTAQEVAEEYTKAFIDDMRAAGVLDPDIRPKATAEINTMIALIEQLVENGHAYVVEGDVYFSVRSYKPYGELSHRNVDEMESGHRELRSDGQGLEKRKHDPLDFALWKAAKPGEPSWSSPWGKGRPGWHIECSAMSEKYLGLPFDIHGGGADLVFPHHENERAQSEAACGCTFANYWMHGGMLQVNAEKMSKSLGNFLLLRDVLKTTSASVLRMLMLQTHYRSPLDFSEARLSEAQTALERIETCVQNMQWLAQTAKTQQETESVERATGQLASQQSAQQAFNAEAFQVAIAVMKDDFVQAMDDDFNTAGALGAVFTFVSEANTLVANATVCADDAETLLQGCQAVTELMSVLGISDVSSEVQAAQKGAGQVCSEELAQLAREAAGYDGTDEEEALEALLFARAKARQEKNFVLADKVRDGLSNAGFLIEDTPQGARVRRK